MEKYNISIRQIIDIYWQQLRRYKLTTATIVLAIILANIVEIIVPFFYKRFFDVLTSPNLENAVGQLTAILVTILGVQILVWALYRTVGYLTVYLQPRMMADLTQTAYWYLMRHSYIFFTNNFAGSLVRKVNRLGRSFETIADQVQWKLIPVAVSVIGILGVLTYRHALLGLALFIWLVFFMAVNYLLARWKYPYDIAKSEKDSETTGVLADAIGNSTTIKLFTGHKHEEGLLYKVTEQLYRLRRWTWQINETVDAVQNGLMVFIEFIMLYVAVRLWQKGILTIGDFALIQAYLITLFNKIWDFGHVVRNIYEGLADAQEMVEILKKPHEIQDTKTAKPLVVSRGRIEFKDVNFNFHKTRTILRHFNLIIEPGERVALVGPSGAGKTTITNLLFRLYDTDHGKIFIDGQNISQATQDSLRQQVSMVPQEPILFHRTLMDNIRYGQREATDKEVIKAAKLANADDFIKDLPEGYKTFVGERGVKLSGGERQRVSIARAILKDAPILALDEATSSLDSESEALIQGALAKLMEGRTTIVIAHRLSTIMRMDRIIVIENGKVVDTGTHADLINKDGIYKKLWEIQAGGFLP